MQLIEMNFNLDPADFLHMGAAITGSSSIEIKLILVLLATISSGFWAFSSMTTSLKVQQQQIDSLKERIGAEYVALNRQASEDKADIRSRFERYTAAVQLKLDKLEEFNRDLLKALFKHPSFKESLGNREGD